MKDSLSLLAGFSRTDCSGFYDTRIPLHAASFQQLVLPDEHWHRSRRLRFGIPRMKLATLTIVEIGYVDWSSEREGCRKMLITHRPIGERYLA
jgi:hypothetical protein